MTGVEAHLELYYDNEENAQDPRRPQKIVKGPAAANKDDALLYLDTTLRQMAVDQRRSLEFHYHRIPSLLSTIEKLYHGFADL